jgi:hypothetical protein
MVFRRNGPVFLLIAAGIQAGLLTCGCKPEKTNASREQSSSQPVEQIQKQEAEFDSSIWRDEVLAQKYEKTFTKLADDFRKAEEKLEALARFEFQGIRIPKAKGAPTKYDLDIQLQGFDDTEGFNLDRVAWQKAVAQFRDAGWSLTEVDWQHEEFVPGTNSTAAFSEFAFELHGEQAAQSNRFILKGRLAIEWSGSAAADGLFQARNITVSKLSLLERSGAPGFANQVSAAPDAAHVSATIDMHPLIVTDVNGDGHDDIIIAGVNRVLLNDGHANLQTVPLIKEENFYPVVGAGLIADFNGDGKLDFLTVANKGPFTRMLVLYPGDGSLPFSTPPVAAWELQRRAFQTFRLEGASVITAADIDHDGDLDVFVGQYKLPYVDGQLPTPYYDANDGYPSYLLLNDGNGHFSLAPPQPALQAKRNRRTLAASLVDINFDGHPDLITVNDFCGVDLFYNDGHGHFTDETSRLDQRHLFGMAHCFADFDRDGILDFLAIGMSIPTVRRLELMNAGRSDFPERTAKRKEMGHGNRLFLERSGRWIEPTFAKQLARSGWSWGVTAADFNNDGNIDVYVANGHVSGRSSEDYDSRYWTHDIYLGSSKPDPHLKRYLDGPLAELNAGKTSWSGYQHNCLFMDLGTNQYLNVAFLMGVAHETDCRAVVRADLNEDGKPDLIITEANWIGTPNTMQHRLMVHLNQLSSSNHWIGVKLASTGLSPIGAKVWAETANRTFVAEIVTGDSFQSQHPNTVHFGLGKAAQVDRLKVLWPNGNVSVLENPSIDTYHSLSPTPRRTDTR